MMYVKALSLLSLVGALGALVSGCPAGPAGGPPCSTDADCETGRYCGGPGIGCALDCRIDVDCTGGGTCSPRGRCEVEAFDAGVPRDGAPTVCRNDGDCDDGVYCNGPERCTPGGAGVPADGCASALTPCASGATCDEDANTCRTTCDEDADGNGRLDRDNDNDGHDSIACDGDDCDDTDSDRYPRSLAEVCDPLAPAHDEDCNPCTVASYVASDGDRDGDRYFDVACSNPLLETDDPATFSCPVSVRDFAAVDRETGVVTGTDCNDMPVAGASIHPTESEMCNGVDDDCDALTDEGTNEMVYVDCDGDGWGEAGAGVLGCHGAALPMALGCTVGGQYVRGRMRDTGGDLAFDCDGGDAAINPMATESCNSINDDCDAVVDEGTRANLYFDGDGDGYGAGAAVSVCIGTPRYFASNTDCDDGIGGTGVNPGATEVCNGRDDNCVAGVDEGLRRWRYLDFDGDGVGAGPLQDVCVSAGGFVDVDGDCRDSDSRVYQAATVRIDQDGDGYCVPGGGFSACVGVQSGNLFSHAWVLRGGIETYYSNVRANGSCLGDECFGANWYGSDLNVHAPAARGCRYEINGAVSVCNFGVCTPATSTMTCQAGYEPALTTSYDRCFRGDSSVAPCSVGARAVSGRSATCPVTVTLSSLNVCGARIVCEPCSGSSC